MVAREDWAAAVSVVPSAVMVGLEVAENDIRLSMTRASTTRFCNTPQPGIEE